MNTHIFYSLNMAVSNEKLIFEVSVMWKLQFWWHIRKHCCCEYLNRDVCLYKIFILKFLYTYLWTFLFVHRYLYKVNIPCAKAATEKQKKKKKTVQQDCNSLKDIPYYFFLFLHYLLLIADRVKKAPTSQDSLNRFATSQWHVLATVGSEVCVCQRKRKQTPSPMPVAQRA